MEQTKASPKTMWTQEQQRVIDSRKRNLLVSAAAGSGKTAVLVERIIQMVTDNEHPIDIDRLLIVTFTNAAAGEMRERIGAAIEKKLMECPENEHLQKQMTLIHTAQITTTHSFCQSVIRNNFNIIDLDPTFRIAEEAELTLMKSDVIARILEEEYEQGTKEFLDFIESYASSKSDEAIEKLILDLYKFSMSYPWPKEWLIHLGDVFEIDSIEQMRSQDFMKLLLSHVSAIVEDLQENMKDAIELADSSDGPYTYIDTLVAEKEQLDRLKGASTYEEFYLGLKGITFGRLPSKKAEGVSEDKKKMVKDLRDGIKKTIDKLLDDYFFQSEEAMLKDMTAVKPVMMELIRLTLRFVEEFQKQKEEKLVLDFNDLEHMALRILVEHTEGEDKPSAVAVEMSEYYDEIMVDEYQDSNLVQETILRSISKERLGKPNMFMVGDVKQSIYKFRLARPELFMEKYNSYTAEDSLYQKIDLHKNFRSRELVLDAINFICEQIMTKKLGNIEYDEDAALYAGATFPETELNISKDSELLLVTLTEPEHPDDELDQVTESNKDGEEEEFTKKEMEAKAVALRIKELVEGENPLYVFDKKGEYRKASYKDIVILLRTISGWAEVFIDVLLSEGIPVYADTASGYFKTLEIKTILNMLRIIDNPLQDIPYTAVLHSPMGGFNNEELAILREVHREEMMHHIVTEYANQEICENEALQQKCIRFVSLLQRFREMENYLSIDELLLRVLEETHYYDFISAMPAGEVRKANVDMLIQRAITFEKSSYRGLFQFIRYMEKLDRYNIDFGEASVNNENDDTVRIMSIHKSKGLEFPVVFVSGMGKNFNTQDSKSRIVIHPELGIGPEVIDLVERTKAPTLVKKVIQKMQVLENLGEELRVLYVALTRAKEKLIMTGFIKDLEKTFLKYQDLRRQAKKQLSYLQLTSAGTYFDYVIPALIKHETIYEELKMFLDQAYQWERKCEHEIPFSLRVVTPSMFVRGEQQKQVDYELRKQALLNWDVSQSYNEQVKNQIHEVMGYEYPFQKEVTLRAKITVSELKRLRQRESEIESEPLIQEGNPTVGQTMEYEPIIPRFMKTEEVMTAAAKGTLYHKVLEEIDLFEMDSKEMIESRIRELILEERIPEETLEKVNINQLYQFTKSELASRMKEANKKKKIYKEQQFVLGIQANEVNEEYVSDEIMLVQGIIDVFFEEDGELVLMDYKTDYIKSRDGKELVDKYKVQLDYYARALEQITGKKVKEKIIYSFFLGKEIKVNA